jgi:REP element-mobilizing transposase RayT
MAQNYTGPFEPGFHYHIYNRAVGKDKLFYSDANYRYFLKLFNKGPGQHLEILAFCLMLNHYHFLAYIKDSTSPKEVSESFRRFGISYSQAINKQEHRMGSLFMRPVKRKPVNDLKYLRSMFCYVHMNPVLHNTRADFRDFKWSSYNSILRNDMSPHAREMLNICFDDLDNFKYVHQLRFDTEKIKDVIIETDI